MRPVPLSAAARYFGLVFGAGFALGAIRVPLIVPHLGERYAELAEMPLMFAAIWFAAGYVVRRYAATGVGVAAWFGVGVFALGFMLAAELLLAVALAGKGVGEYIASRDPVSGTVYLVMLAVFASMPCWQYRRLQRDGRIHPK